MISGAVKTALTVVLLVVIVLGGLRARTWWRERQVAKRAEFAQTAAREAAVVAALKAERDSARADAARARAAGTIVLTTPRVPDAPPRPAVPPKPQLQETSRDSLLALVGTLDAHIDTLMARVDTLQRRDSVSRVRIADLIRTSRTDSLTADSTINSLNRRIVAMQGIIDTPVPDDWTGIGACAGYVAVYSKKDKGGDVRHGPGVCVGGTLRIPWRGLIPFL